MLLSYDWFMIYSLGNKDRNTRERVIIHLLPTRQTENSETILPFLPSFVMVVRSPSSQSWKVKLAISSNSIKELCTQSCANKTTSYTSWKGHIQRNMHGLTWWPAKLKSLCDEGDRTRYHVFGHLNVHLVPFATFLASPDRLKVP